MCNNLRISRNRVFKDCAKRAKTSTGWLFSFKLHITINDCVELVNFKLTLGNVDDRKVVELLTKHLKGLLFADRGYISKSLTRTLSNI